MKRIKVISAVLALLFTAIVVHTLVEVILEAPQAFLEGWNSVKSNEENESAHGLTQEYLYLNLQAKSGHRYSSVITGSQSNEELPFDISTGRVLVKVDGAKLPTWIVIFETLVLITMLYFLVAIIAIPVLFYFLIASTTKGNILTKKNVRHCRKLGWIVLSLYAFPTLFYLLNYFKSKHIVSFSDYTVQMEYADSSILFLGLLILLVAEILHVSLTMKEEQDLTI